MGTLALQHNHWIINAKTLKDGGDNTTTAL